MHVALADREAGLLRRCGERGLAVLSRAPDLALVRRVERGRIHRLHGGVVEVGEAVDCLDLALGGADAGLGVARLVADEGLFGVEPGFEELGDAGAGHLGGPDLPLRVEHPARGVVREVLAEVDRRSGAAAAHAVGAGGADDAGRDGRAHHAVVRGGAAGAHAGLAVLAGVADVAVVARHDAAWLVD